MAILPGKRLGPYEILSAIGAGGMGEVYRARDTRLDRIVAIKVLPAHLADEPERRERFEREARTIASLNHPHICVLHDIGRQDGIDFLVMEYLEGETLAQRLLKGPLPLEQVLQYAIEIADALDKAHRKGVTHRDLKPGNVMLTKSGTKLLDFGLAKLKQETAPANISLSKLPTAKDNLTAQGTILGTLQYMAPEQVEGGEVDARTDIFAFGAVVYEMATDKKAFEGKSQASLIAAILEREPPAMSSLQPMTPPALDRLVKKCLRKDRDDRWQSARDVTDELKWIAEGGSQVSSQPTAPAKGIRALGRRALIFSLGALLLGLAIASLATWNLKPAPALSPKSVSRVTITLPPGQQLAGLENGPAVALSADGTHLAYVARQGSTQQIYLRAMDSLEARPVSGTEGANSPFFSPDGQWLGFFAGGKLRKILVSGGTAQTLASGDAFVPRGASWGSQGKIVFRPTASGPLEEVSDSAGTPQTPAPLRKLEKGEVSHSWPEFLPDAKSVLFAAVRTTGPGNAKVSVQSVETGERRDLIPAGTYPRYAASGHLVYAVGGTLMAVPFDPKRLQITGAAVPVIEGVMQPAGTAIPQYTISATGSLIFVSGGVEVGERRLVWVNRSGAEQPVAAPARDYGSPRLSPDGRRIAVYGERQVLLYDLAREALTRLTVEGTNVGPVWTPDGKRIAFYSNREGPYNIFWQPADGSGGPERLTVGENIKAPVSWSPDGQLLTFIEVDPNTERDIWVLRMSDRKAEPFLHTPADEIAPQFSPDGHWLAYASSESGHYEIYVQPYPGPGGKWQISTEGGKEPAWNRNGRELFYRNGDRMMAVDVATQPSFSAGKPKVLFEGQYHSASLGSVDYDVSPDARRFLMIKENEHVTAVTQINVVLNWFEELKQKVPAGKK